MEDYITLMKEAREQMKSKSRTVSVKDLTFCQRQNVFKIIEPIRMTDEELYSFVSGQAAHDGIGRLFMMFPNKFKLEMQIQYENVKGKIDVYDKLLHTVIDVKTTNSNIMLRPKTWDEQRIKHYMSMVDSEEGAVIYQMNIVSKYLIFPIHMNELQRKEHLTKLEVEARSLQHAIELGDLRRQRTKMVVQEMPIFRSV
jgi:hypothetical protein